MNPFDEEAMEGSGVDESEDDAEIALFASPTNGGGECTRSRSRAAEAARSFCLVGVDTAIDVVGNFMSVSNSGKAAFSSSSDEDCNWA